MVATAYATLAEQKGEGVLHVATPGDLAGLRVRLGRGYLPHGAEAQVDTTPADFAARPSITIAARTARGALSDMGVFVLGQIGSAGDLNSFLRDSPLLSAEQVADFYSRIRG